MVKFNSVNFGIIILAGGAASRMGFCKSELKIQGQHLLELNIEKMRPLFKEFSLVISKKSRFIKSLPINKIINPYHPSCGAITGLLAGMSATDAPFSFVVACDMPFINLDIIKKLMEITKKGDDVIIPHSSGGLEPLFAIYSRRCLPILKEMVKEGKFRIQEMFAQLNVRYLSSDEVTRLNPSGTAFFNINNQQDMELAEKIYYEINENIEAENQKQRLNYRWV